LETYTKSPEATGDGAAGAEGHPDLLVTGERVAQHVVRAVGCCKAVEIIF